ncbi:zinc finger protein 831 isoform X3 [Callorhinus ursinus]|uniref:Zinc finger protein 831 isoform X3 n=1 Tax=Callorhinus ursinus TaxID=34884 RepID=A0A3Q7MPN7_CALUR|nr:zinc finger protein 831 isoform X3 [Callorhinus ursinus]
MEVPELTRAFSPAGGQPALAPRHPGAPGGQVSSHLTLGPVILPPEQGLAPTVFLKALPIPLYHTVPPGGLQPRAPPVTHSLDGGSIPFILSPLLRPEGPGPTQAGKPVAPALTVNIVGTLPVLSPGLGPTLGSPGKVRNAGKYLCPHCGRDCLKPSVLEKHIRSHTGERPFPCATCGIAFKTQSNLYKHRRTQTHLNHSRLSSESDGGGGSLLEEGDKAGESSGADGRGDSSSPRVGGGARSERPLSVGAQGAGHCPAPAMPLSSVAKTLGLKLEAVPCPGSTFADRETPVDSAHTASPGPALAGSQPRWKLPEQTSPTASRLCSLQQQQVVTSSEKPWDAKALEGRLRKCESTDSGYLSRSDSAEQPPAPGSPLHSLSGHSAESEVEVALGPGGPSLQLEKKQLEERIAWLISHNQAVVDDSQLDNVRPRKTVLCKQGSIDLPMPYTYKDSFHFDIRALQPGRRKPAALSSARSTFILPDKAQPLFFHSVPTQLSTTVACVPITRSNSLPLVEGTRTWQEPPGPQDACPRRQKPLSPRPAPAQLVNVPSGHPRALVRQAAVEDLPCPPTGDSLVPAEDSDRNRAAAGVGAASKGRAGSKKCSQRKLKMFSQDKWQVYGNETFKRIYQKMKTSCHGGKKLSCPVASGMVSQPEWKKGPPWRKVKMFRGSGKQKLSIRSRRYKGSFLQSRVQPKGGGPRRPPRVLRKDRHLPPLEGLGPRGTCRQPSSEMAGLNLQEEPSRASSESPVGCGHREKEEEGSRQTSGSFSPSTSSRARSGIDPVIMKVISPAAGGCSDCHHQNTAAGSGQSERPGSCVAVGTDRLLSPGRSLSLGLLETRPLPSQEQVSVDMKPYISSDAQEPSSFESKGTSPCQDVAPSVAAICALGERAGHTTLGIHSAEPQAQRAAGEALTQSSSDRKAKAEGMSPPVLPGRPSSEQRISGLVLLESTGKTRLEIPASGAGSASSYQEEGEHKMFSPTGVQEGRGEMVVPCPPLGNESGKCRGSGLTALKDRVVPFNPGQPRESPESPSKTVKRRGLEGLRKQTRVEVSDTSSDDEDRLVIEM